MESRIRDSSACGKSRKRQIPIAALRIQAFLVVFSMKTTKKAPRFLGELSDPF